MKSIIAIIIVYFIAGGNANTCGITLTKPGDRVVGGYAPYRRSWPWIVSISYGSPIPELGTNGGHICGGTLISTQWVLTAAHCLDIPGKPNEFPKVVPKEWRVTAGMYNRTVEEEKEGHWQTSPVRRFLYHKKFEDFNYYSVHDVAMVQLAKPFHVTDFVRPICLPGKIPEIRAGWNECYIAGWGTTNENSTQHSLTLQEVPMLIVAQSFCQSVYTTPSTYRLSQHICGGDWYNGNRDACKGDSGGPLACKNDKGIWHVSGIISFGIGCGRRQTPGVYTSVHKYQEWIISVARQYSVAPTKKSNGSKTALSATRRKRSTVLKKSVIESTQHLSPEVRNTLWQKIRSRKRRTTSHIKQKVFNLLTRGR